MHSIREVPEQDREAFDRLAPHPMQSWEWGAFRIKTGIEVLRVGKYVGKKLEETVQITIHPIPFTSRTIGYLPKGNIPSAAMMQALREKGKEHGCVFIKLEPNVIVPPADPNGILHFVQDDTVKRSPHPLFTTYTFQLDLTKSEVELLKGMHHKTRYNIRVAQKQGVVVREDDSPEALEAYLHLTFETTKRQHFYAHTEKYHRLMWETMRSGGIAHLFTATYREVKSDSLPAQAGTPGVENEHTLVTWIVFLFNNVLYYPYGASSDQFRNTMASNLMMWDVIRWGKAHGATLFDMWGALGPDPDPKDPWYGFHRFKQGYGAELVTCVGSYDLVIDPMQYRIYNTLHYLRQFYLRLRSSLR